MINLNELPAAAIQLNHDLVITDINHYAICHRLNPAIQINRSVFEIDGFSHTLKEAIIRAHQNNIDLTLDWNQCAHPITLVSPSIINDTVLYLNTKIITFDDSLLLLFFDCTNEAQATFEYRKKNDELQKLSVSCQLTGLYNRRFAMDFFKKLNQNETSFGMLMFDLDHFKNINDTYGHIIGDEVLRYFSAKVLRPVFRSSDAVCRIGGEEFAVLFNANSREDVTRSAERVWELANNSSFHVRGKSDNLTITASCGGALFETAADLDFDQCLEIIDNALYEVKKNGRNDYKVV